MLQDEKIRYQAYATHAKKWIQLRADAGFTPKQTAAFNELHRMILEVARVVWKEEGELMKPPSPN